MTPDPFASWPIYQSQDYRPPEAASPLYIHDWAELREQCRIALERRRKAYPKWIEARNITAEVAARDIAAWEELLGFWTWVVDGEDAEGAALPPRLTLVDRIEAVDLAMLRIDQEIRRGNRTHDILLQSHLNQALRWHLDRERFCQSTVIDGIVLIREIRADIAARRQAAAMPDRKAA